MQRDEFDDEALLTCKPLVLHTMRRKTMSPRRRSLTSNEKTQVTRSSHGPRHRLEVVTDLAGSIGGRVKGRESDSQITGSSTTSAWSAVRRRGKKYTTPPKQRAPVAKCRSIGLPRTCILDPAQRILHLYEGPRAFNPTHAAFSAGTLAQQRFLMGIFFLQRQPDANLGSQGRRIVQTFGTDPDLILIEGGTRGAQALISGDLPIMVCPASQSSAHVLAARI